MPDDNAYIEDLLANVVGDISDIITSKAEWLSSGINSWNNHLLGTLYDAIANTYNRVVSAQDNLTQLLTSNQTALMERLDFSDTLTWNMFCTVSWQFNNYLMGAFDSVERAISESQSTVSDKVTSGIDSVKSVLDTIGNGASNVVGGISDALIGVIQNGIDKLSGWFTDIWGKYYELWRKVAEVITSIPTWIESVKTWFESLGTISPEEFREQVLTIQKNLLGVS